MRVTFIVPAFNAEETLGETIESVLAQQSDCWSAVIVDDGSTDRTREIACGFGDKRIHVISQENRGLSAARNTGLRRVMDLGESEFACFLDADDCVSPSYAKKMIEAIGNNDIAPAAFRMMSERMEDVGWVVQPGGHDFTLDRLVHVNAIAVSAAMVRISAMQRLGVLDEDDCLFDESLRSAEDWDLWLRATEAGARWAVVVEEPVFNYRMRRGSMSDALRTMHESSERVIMRCGSRERELAVRGLSLRSAARAAAAGDHDFARERLSAVTPLHARDVGILVGALRYAFMFAECIGPKGAEERWPIWQSSIEAAFSGCPALPDILEQLSFDADRIPMAARGMLRQIRGDQIPVIYGAGRNGKSFAQALSSVLPETKPAWVDDHTDAGGQYMGARLRVGDLTSSHYVVVTPDENSEILRRLSGTDAMVETIASLARDQSA